MADDPKLFYVDAESKKVVSSEPERGWQFATQEEADRFAAGLTAPVETATAPDDTERAVSTESVRGRGK